MTGFISEPDMAKSNRNMENFFINGRYVKSRTASAAVEQAYSSKSQAEKFPFCVINIEINPSIVDVNVHPAKLEVKFTNEKLIFDAVYYAVLNALEADIILLGGDYGEDAAHTLEFFRLLPPLKAKLAVCGVIGNHDRAEATAEELIDAMETCGITPLVNSTLTLEMDGKKLCICATDDLSHGDPAFNEVKEQVFGADYVIYAPHSPDALEAAREEGADGFYDLVVCGHTHGGQVAIFGFAPYTSSLYGARYGNLYLSGEIEEDDGTQIIISNGVGTTWMPVRFGAPPQYHLITLRRARPER